jgi:CubicO group peptidase (beta-lactamase class C family)
MKKLKLILLTLLYVINFLAYSQESKSKQEDLSKLIDVWMESEMDYQNIPFMSAAVVDNQKVLWSGAFGNVNVESSLLANENTMSSVCSVSKVFTATAVMKLVDEGKISLDDKVKDILPKFSIIQKFPKGGEITIRSLLAHTSGLPRDTNHGYWGGPDHDFPSEDELFDSLPTLETERPVGTEIGYSNIGYALLGQVIEEVTGATYKNYMESNIFKPLDMSNSVVEMQSSLYGNKHAIGYTALHRNGKRKRANFYQGKAMQPAMGISSSALDLAKFAMWQFRLADASQAEIMKPSTLKSMYKTQGSKKGEFDRGFGYVVHTDKKGREWAMHGGVCPGYVAFLRMDVKNKKAYSILVSANKGGALKNVNRLVGIIEKAEEISTNENNEEGLSQYEGYYNVNPWNSEYYVGKLGNALVSLHLPFENVEWSLRQYQHIKDDSFQIVENSGLIDEEANFIRDKQGNILKFQNMGNYHFKMTSPPEK